MPQDKIEAVGKVHGKSDYDRVSELVTAAQRAFDAKPAAKWSKETYIAPLDAHVMRRLLADYRRLLANMQSLDSGEDQ